MAFVAVRSGSDARAVMQRLRPQLYRYRALFTPSQTFARAAQLEAPQLPVVFDGVNDPVTLCLIDSYSRPGRNATGYMHYLPRSEEKMLQTLHDAFPALREAFVVVSGDLRAPRSCSPDDENWTAPFDADCSTGPTPTTDRTLASTAARLGLRVSTFVICRRDDFATLANTARERGAGLVVSWHTLFDNNRRALVDAINQARRPAIYPSHAYSRDGGLMSLEVIADQGKERSSVLALLQVLGGREPATLPVQSPRGFTLMVNAPAAQATSLHPSLTVLRRAETILRDTSQP